MTGDLREQLSPKDDWSPAVEATTCTQGRFSVGGSSLAG